MNLVVSNLSRVVGGTPHLEGIELNLVPGRIYTVIGRTGSGKTSLLRAIAGLDAVDEGELTLDGVNLLNVPVWKRDTSMVYQQFINYPHMSVFENVVFPLRRAKVDAAEAEQRATESLAKVGLGAFHSRRPSQLSGGQQQRVALARALARRSRLLLLDEPLVNLDFKLREQLREELKELFSGVGDAIVVYTTTEPAEAMELGDEMIVMHEGRILQSGPPDLVFDNPRNPEVAAIVNDPPMNIFPTAITDGQLVIADFDAKPCPSHLAQLADGPYQMGIRAPDLVVVHSGGLLGSISFVEISGSETFAHVSIGMISVIVQLEGIHNLTVGEPIHVSIIVDRLFAFNPMGELLVAPVLSKLGAR